MHYINILTGNTKMKQELQQKLYDTYPKLFIQKDLPPQQTAMCWGICCGDGWYDLIDNYGKTTNC